MLSKSKLLLTLVTLLAMVTLMACSNEPSIGGAPAAQSDSRSSDDRVSPLTNSEIAAIANDNLRDIIQLIRTYPKPVSQIDSIDCDSIAEMFYANCSDLKAQVALRSNMVAYPNENDFLNQLPDSISEILIRSYVDADYDLLGSTVERIEETSWYQNLTETERNNFDRDLLIFVTNRDVLIESIFSAPHSRMSPGDRMIWSDAARNATDEQRRLMIKAGLTGIRIVGVPIISAAAGLISLFV